MSVTAYKAPGTAASVDRDSKTAWTDPDNIKVLDASDAENELGKDDYGDWIRATNFGFTATDIPVGATIDGIEVSIYRYATSADGATDSALYMRDSTGQVGDNEASATEWPGSVTEKVYGGSEDMLGTTLDQADIVASTFGIDLSVQNSIGVYHTVQVDFIRIRVYYTHEPPPRYAFINFQGPGIF